MSDQPLDEIFNTIVPNSLLDRADLHEWNPRLYPPVQQFFNYNNNNNNISIINENNNNKYPIIPLRNRILSNILEATSIDYKTTRTLTKFTWSDKAKTIMTKYGYSVLSSSFSDGGGAQPLSLSTVKKFIITLSKLLGKDKTNLNIVVVNIYILLKLSLL